MATLENIILVTFILYSVATSDSIRQIDKRNGELVGTLECRICTGIPRCTAQANPYACQCDVDCALFNDCCEGSFEDLGLLEDECPDSLSDLSSLYRCNSVVTNEPKQTEIAVYMISECPRGWFEAEGDDEVDLFELVSTKCQTATNNFPPVSDFDTGLVYKNEFCALCHNVRSPVLWLTLYFCSNRLTITTDDVVTPQLLSDFCLTQNYYPPPLHFLNSNLPRFCYPSITTCLSEDEALDDISISYTELLNVCQNGYQNLVTRDGTQMIFRNEYCALCNGYNVEELQCFNDTTYFFTTLVPSESILSVSLLLDTVNKNTQFSNTKERFSFVDNCQPDSIFNTNNNACQNTTVCSFVINGEPTEDNGCDSSTTRLFNDKEDIPEIVNATSMTPNNNTDDKDYEGDGTVNATTDTPTCSNSTGAPTNNTGEDGSEYTCQSVVAIEDASEYVAINQTLIFYKPLGVITLVIDMNPNQLPIVCLDLAIPFINPQTLRLFLMLQRFYGGLVFVTSIISVVLCLLVVSVYLMRPMRSVFGVVVINIAVIFLVSDVVIILVGHSTFAAANQGLCVFAAVAEQLINLALFVWLAIFAVDVAIRYHRNANSLQPRSKKRVVITYLLVGWIIPIALTGVGIAANFVSRGAFVQYCLEGSCHINHSQSALALLAIPDLISIFIAVVALIVILVLLCKVHYSFKKKDKCRFVLLFIFYPILAVLWFIWYSTLGGRFSRIVKFFLPFLFLFRSIFFFFMVAFSKKVLKTIRGLLGLQRSKINPSGGEAMEDEPHPEHKEGQRDSVKSFIGEQNQQNIRESFASYLENPMLSSHVSAWEDADRKDIN